MNRLLVGGHFRQFLLRLFLSLDVVQVTISIGATPNTVFLFGQGTINRIAYRCLHLLTQVNLVDSLGLELKWAIVILHLKFLILAFFSQISFYFVFIVLVSDLMFTKCLFESTCGNLIDKVTLVF